MPSLRKVLIFTIITLPLLYSIEFVRAQSLSNDWTTPLRLSEAGRRSTEGFMVADKFGYVHVFWYEYDPSEGNSTLEYSRFDGEFWTEPVDIFLILGDATHAMASPFIDQNGILYLIWADTFTGPVNYSSVPVYEATFTRSWQKPIRINLPASFNKLLVDSNGVFHILYAIVEGDQPGIYYIRSENDGKTWNNPTWLDSDIPSDLYPNSLEFSLDETDGLHAVWYYEPLNSTVGGQVRYSHSLNGGQNWSYVTIDIDSEVSGRLRSSVPVLTVDRQTIHIIWTSELKRYHTFSEDAGLNWSSPVQIMGDLEGQAFDGLAVDGAGRVHFFSQIRYPMAIYHSIYDQGSWSVPSMIYFIQGSYDQEIEDRIHAHHVHPAVRSGNQLIVTFADEPGNPDRQLYYIGHNLDDIPPETPIPTLTKTQNEVKNQSEVTVVPTLLEDAEVISDLQSGSKIEIHASSTIFFIGLLPVLLVIGGLLLIIYFRNR